MRSGPAIIALLLLPHLGQAQVTIVGPGAQPPGQATRPSEANYGPPRVVDLDNIVLGDGYQRAHVITEGEVSPFQQGQYWTLRQGTSTVLIIPGRDASHATSAARYLEECLAQAEYWDVSVAEQTEHTLPQRVLQFLDRK